MGFLTRVKWIGLLTAVCVLLAANLVCAQQPGGPVPHPLLPAPKATDRILVVSPHPDDETIGAGGYLDQAVKAGATIRIVVATDGAKRGRSSTRYRETLSAVNKLGVPANDVMFLGYPDGRLSRQTTFQARLEAIDADFHPNIVIATHPNDTHPDHAAVGRAVDLLGQHSNHTLTAYFFVVHYPHYPLPDAYRPDVDEQPAPHLPDTISHWEGLPLPDQIVQAKRDAVLEYHTQILPKNPLRRGLLISFIRKNEIFAVRSY